MKDRFDLLHRCCAAHLTYSSDIATLQQTPENRLPTTSDLFESEVEPSISTSVTITKDNSPANLRVDLTGAEQNLLNLLGYDVVSVDLAVERSEMPVEDISIILMSLELKGVVQSVPGGFQVLRDRITA